MKKLKIALIGAGNIACAHLNAYRSVPNAEIYAICDIDEEQLNETADQFGIKHRFTDVDTMLKALPELDAADVCVWNCNHAACTMAALNAGLHVLCEKPMAYNAKEAEEMCALAKEKGKLLMIGFVMRFSDESRIACDFINAGTLGEIYYSKATYVRRHGAPGGWFTNTKYSGGGPVIDLGVHVIDHTRWLMGNPKPVSVYAVTFKKLGQQKDLKNGPGWTPKRQTGGECYDVEDLATALIRYDNGATTLLETSYELHGEGVTQKMLYGTKGGMSLAGKPKVYTVVNDYLADVTPIMECYKESREMFVAEMEHFVDCALNGTECMAPAEDGVTVMRILDAIYESARTGHEVTL